MIMGELADDGVTTPTTISFVLMVTSPPCTSSSSMQMTAGPATSVLPSTAPIMPQLSSTQLLQASPMLTSQAPPTTDGACAFNISHYSTLSFHCAILCLDAVNVVAATVVTGITLLVALLLS